MPRVFHHIFSKPSFFLLVFAIVVNAVVPIEPSHAAASKVYTLKSLGGSFSVNYPQSWWGFNVSDAKEQSFLTAEFSDSENFYVDVVQLRKGTHLSSVFFFTDADRAALRKGWKQFVEHIKKDRIAYYSSNRRWYPSNKVTSAVVTSGCPYPKGYTCSRITIKANFVKAGVIEDTYLVTKDKKTVYMIMAYYDDDYQTTITKNPFVKGIQTVVSSFRILK